MDNDAVLDPSQVPPGRILSLMGSQQIDATSVFWNQAAREFCKHLVLVLSISADGKLVHLHPLLGLQNRSLQDARGQEFVWPRYVLVQHRNTRDSIDPRDRKFKSVHMTDQSDALSGTFWIYVRQQIEVELRYLRPYNDNGVKSYSLSGTSLQTVMQQSSIHGQHAPCIEMPPDTDVSNLLIGHIYRLSEIRNAQSMIKQQITNSYERPLGHPFLVTAIHGAGAVVSGFPITSFAGKAITDKYRLPGEHTRWLRSQYLVIEGSDAQSHDGLPVLQLGQGSQQMRLPSYVHVGKMYNVEHWWVKQWSAQPVFLADGQVELAENYSRYVRSGVILQDVMAWRQQQENGPVVNWAYAGTTSFQNATYSSGFEASLGFNGSVTPAAGSGEMASNIPGDSGWETTMNRIQELEEDDPTDLTPDDSLIDDAMTNGKESFNQNGADLGDYHGEVLPEGFLMAKKMAQEEEKSEDDDWTWNFLDDWAPKRSRKRTLMLDW